MKAGRRSETQHDLNPPADEPARDTRIEDYLDHLTTPLVDGGVPYAVRHEVRREIRQHLLACATAYEELGRSPDEAVPQAIAQFGNPTRIGRRWLCEWQSAEPPHPVHSVRHATFVALSVFGLATISALALSLLAGSSALFSLAWMNTLLACEAVAAPTLAGLITGLRARRRPSLGTFYALALLIPLNVGLLQLLPLVKDDLPALAGVQFIFWVPIGCIAAALGGWLRKQAIHSPSPWALPQ